MPNTAENNDRITICFTGLLDNGAIFAEVATDNPLTLTLGESELPPTVEMALIGLSIGATQKVRISPDEGFGPRLKDLVHEIPRANFNLRFDPKPGMVISQTLDHDGKHAPVPATIIEVTDDKIVIDYNHPLAGHHLTYNITLLAIEKMP